MKDSPAAKHLQERNFQAHGGDSSNEKCVRPAAEQTLNWGYSNATGPEHWGDLAPEFALCKLGRTQSPVNIAQTEPRRLETLQFDLHPAPLHIVNEGHTIRADHAPGSFLAVGRERYELEQLHFHRPSEHRINGHAFSMEAHAVFHGESGQRAVLGIFLDASHNLPNALLQTLWAQLPERIGAERSAPQIAINLAGLLPRTLSYYRYDGSLTTPPCTENVRWFLLREAVAVSRAQVARFAAIYPHNARPVQPLGGRKILASGD